MKQHRESLVLAAITLIALALRVYVAATTYLNPDEALRLLAASRGDYLTFQNPPVLYWWLQFASAWSGNVLWLRMLPVLAGALTPFAAAMWFRSFLSPATSWLLAVLLACAPDLVVLSAQLRSYSLAMFCTAASLWMLERAFAGRFRVALFLHFVALWTGILSELSMAWVALAAGLYGLIRLIQTRPTKLIPAWVGGQVVALALYGELYIYFIAPLLHPDVVGIDAWSAFLIEAFPRSAESLVYFFAKGAFSQLAYVTGSLVAGAIAAIAFVAGVVHWAKIDWPRTVLMSAPFLASVAAVYGLFPFGRTRHTVVIGLVALAAVGAGVEWATARHRVLRAAAAFALVVIAIMTRTRDPHNIPRHLASLEQWETGVTELLASTPSNALFVVDEEVSYMLGAEALRRERSGQPTNMPRMKVLQWDWANEVEDRSALEARLDSLARELHPSGQQAVLIDGGFEVSRLQRFLEPSHPEEIVRIEGVLYAALLTR